MTAAMTIAISVTVFANLFLVRRSTCSATCKPTEPSPDHPTGIEFYV